MLIYNNEKLIDVLKAFFRTTGARVAIFDTDMNEVIAYPKQLSTLCHILRKNNNILKLCKKCDQKAFKKCLYSKKIVTYECDMGLFESIAPILTKNQEVVGFIMMGQILCLSSAREVIEKANKFFTNTLEIQSAVEKTKIISKDKLEASSYLMNLCIEYICSNSFISQEAQGIHYQFDEFILNNLSKRFNANEVANHFYVSRTSLHNILKKNFNMSFSQRINFLKIEESKKMLKDHYSINYICETLGFYEKSYFFKVFKNYTGLTTKQYLSKEHLNFFN